MQQSTKTTKLTEFFDMSSLKNFEHKLRQIAEEEKATQDTDCADGVELMEEQILTPDEFVYTCSIQFKKAGHKLCQVYISQGELYVARLTNDNQLKVMWKDNITSKSRATLLSPYVKQGSEDGKKSAKQQMQNKWLYPLKLTVRGHANMILNFTDMDERLNCYSRILEEQGFDDPLDQYKINTKNGLLSGDSPVYLGYHRSLLSKVVIKPIAKGKYSDDVTQMPLIGLIEKLRSGSTISA